VENQTITALKISRANGVGIVATLAGTLPTAGITTRCK